MLRLSKHIDLLRIIFAVLFIVGSSGFAMVLNRCVMGKMDCCTMPMEKGHDRCDGSSSKQTGPSIRTDFVCHISTLVGGFTTSSGLLVEKDQNHKQVVLVGIEPHVDLIRQFIDPTVSTLLPPETASPPSRAKYVLNSSFLI